MPEYRQTEPKFTPALASNFLCPILAALFQTPMIRGQIGAGKRGKCRNQSGCVHVTRFESSRSF